MIRYFDLHEKRVCAKLTIQAGSAAATAPAKEFEAVFKTPVREISRTEHDRLKREYTKTEVPTT